MQNLNQLHLFPGGIMDQLHSHDTVCSRYTVLQTNCWVQMSETTYQIETCIYDTKL